MYFCFKVPMKQQRYENACWLHAMATVCCAGHDTQQQLGGKVDILVKQIEREYETGFVEEHTTRQGILAADFINVYTQQEFARFLPAQLNKLLNDIAHFSEDELSAFFNEFGPLVFVKPAAGQGFHALPIMGAAINPDPNSNVTELLAVETMEGRAKFIPPDEFNDFLVDFSSASFEGMKDVFGLWYYLPFHNNTQVISKYSEEKVREMAERIYRGMEFKAYTGTPPSSGSSDQNLESDISDSSDSAHELVKQRYDIR